MTESSSGAWIRSARSAAGMSQVLLAERVGVTQPTVSAWEGGRQPVPQDKVDLIADALSIPVPQVPTVEDYREEKRRGALAADAVPLAQDLACLVRDEGREAIGRFMTRLAPEGLPEHVVTLLVVLAAMVPVEDHSPGELLGWVTWDEHSRPLTGDTQRERAA